MVVHDIEYAHSNGLFIHLFKNESLWLKQVHSILSLSLALQSMASADSKLDKHLNGGCGPNLINALMNYFGHLISISFRSFFGIFTYLLELLCSVNDL